MIISIIELCNPSVADQEGEAPALQYPKKKETNLGFYMLPNAIQALDFDIFLKGHAPGPL